jgi:hypothetical protein
MKSLPVLLAVALLGMWAGACGGLHKGTAASPKVSASNVGTAASSGTARTSATASGDYDNDDGRRSGVDDDAITIRSYGYAAGPAERFLIVALVRRYFAAAAVDDGARACRMIDKGLAKAVPLDYGKLGPSYLHGGKTCAAVLARLFKHDRRRLVAEARQLKVTGVRLEGGEGFVLLGFGKGTPERQIAIEHGGSGGWKIEVLEDGPMRLAP